MLLETVSARDFRNLAGDLQLAEGLNILVGENGQGKTNWLEAIAVLASTRSFRTGQLREAMRFGSDTAIIRGNVRESPHIIRELQVAVGQGSKTLLVNGKKETAPRYLGQLHAVVFNADELEVIRGVPDARRRFLDAGIVSLHPPFIRTLTDYSRVIKQKNALLQTARDLPEPLEVITDRLAPWNEQLKSLAARIYRARVRFIERLNEVLESGLFEREVLSIRYVSSLEGKGDLSAYEELIAERLSLRVQAEVAAGYALLGTHRDDVEITFDGHDIRKYGSAGQQRSALLLLQLASIAVYNATRGEYPLFLIDDIDAELDYGRIARLLDFLKNKTQTIVTTSKEGFIEKFGSTATVLRVEGGSAKTV